MKAYYAKREASQPVHTKKKFLYVRLDESDVVKLNIVVSSRIVHHDHGTEVHLTTNGAFDAYCAKRLATPRLVRIFNTQNELNETLEQLGYCV